MNRPPSALLVLGLAALPGCPSHGGPIDGGGNPAVLWLALDGSETRVRLVDAEPLPF